MMMMMMMMTVMMMMIMTMIMMMMTMIMEKTFWQASSTGLFSPTSATASRALSMFWQYLDNVVMMITMMIMINIMMTMMNVFDDCDDDLKVFNQAHSLCFAIPRHQLCYRHDFNHKMMPINMV